MTAEDARWGGRERLKNVATHPVSRLPGVESGVTAGGRGFGASRNSRNPRTSNGVLFVAALTVFKGKKEPWEKQHSGGHYGPQKETLDSHEKQTGAAAVVSESRVKIYTSFSLRALATAPERLCTSSLP